MRLRPATPDDLDTLYAFHRAISEWERPCDPTMRPAPLEYKNIEGLLRDPNALVLVAITDEGQVVASGSVQRNRAHPWSEPDYNAFLGLMYVEPAFRGQGLNQQIMEGLEAWAREQKLYELRLTVYAENPSAVRAYEKVGYAPLLVEMRKSIAPQD